MSVPNQTPYNIYTANGLTTVFPYEFYLLNDGDLAVSLNGSVITSGYTISGVGNVDGGEVSFLTPPANGVTVMLERVIPTYRLTDYQDNGDLLADIINKDFDRLWMAIQQAFIYLGLALTRPLLGGPFNAKGYRIENLGYPVNSADAASKQYVDAVSQGDKDHAERLFKRSIRVPEDYVNPAPSVSVRRNMLFGWNSGGQPIAVSANTETADLSIKLASSEGGALSGIGYPEGTTFNYSTVQFELGYSLDMFGGDPTGVNNSYDAMARALAFLATSDAKFKVLKLHGKYKISGSTGFTLPPGVSIVGNHEGMTQGPQTEQAWPQDYAYDSTLIIDLPPGVDCFTATANNVFAGFSVIYYQPQSVSSAADFIQYGWFIRSNSRSMALVNMRYAGAYNWAYFQGECPFVENVYGYAINIDYRAHRSADVGRFSNVHINPNVTRPAWSFINAAAMIPTSCAFHFTEHDGMFINDTHVFGKNKVVINNQNGSARLCTVNGSNWLVDKCGTLLKSDINSGLTWGVNNGTFISRYCSEGGGVMLTNPLATQVSGYQFEGWKFQIDLDTNPVTAVGPLPSRWFEFGTASGCRVWLHNFIVLAMPNMEFNNDAQSNLIEGSATIGTRTIIFDNKPKNRLSNVWLSSVDPATNIPYGYTASGSNIVINRNVVTSKNPTSSNGVGIYQRVFTSFTGACSVWVYASAVGDSVGVSAIAYLADFGSPIVFPSTGPAKWERFGNEYLARISIPSSTNRVIWDVVAAAPSATGGVLAISDFNLTPGNPLTYWHGSPEVQLQSQQVMSYAGTVNLTPGVPLELPRNLWGGDTGIITIYVKTSNSCALFSISKRIIGLDGNVTLLNEQVGSESISVAWPAGSGKRPIITCSASSTASIKVSGV